MRAKARLTCGKKVFFFSNEFFFLFFLVVSRAKEVRENENERRRKKLLFKTHVDQRHVRPPRIRDRDSFEHRVHGLVFQLEQLQSCSRDQGGGLVVVVVGSGRGRRRGGRGHGAGDGRRGRKRGLRRRRCRCRARHHHGREAHPLELCLEGRDAGSEQGGVVFGEGLFEKMRGGEEKEKEVEKRRGGKQATPQRCRFFSISDLQSSRVSRSFLLAFPFRHARHTQCSYRKRLHRGRSSIEASELEHERD